MTTKQALATKYHLEEGLPVSKAMLKAGYSPHTAKVPDELTNSKAYKAFIKQQLPLEDLLHAHKNVLKATKWNDFTGEREPDHALRLKGVTEGYKLYGLHTENHGQSNTQINISVGDGGYNPPKNTLGIRPSQQSKP